MLLSVSGSMGGVAVTPKDRKRLGEAVRAARIEVGLTANEAASRAGISPTTWGQVERGADISVRGLTYAAVEKVLRWEPGSVSRVLDGDEPVPVGTAAVRSPPPMAGGGPVDYITAWETQIVTEIWAKRHLTDEQKEELTLRARARAAEVRAVEDRVRRSAS